MKLSKRGLAGSFVRVFPAGWEVGPGVLQSQASSNSNLLGEGQTTHRR